MRGLILCVRQGPTTGTRLGPSIDLEITLPNFWISVNLSWEVGASWTKAVQGINRNRTVGAYITSEFMYPRLSQALNKVFFRLQFWD